jgi:hypothetical protein
MEEQTIIDYSNSITELLKRMNSVLGTNFDRVGEFKINTRMVIFPVVSFVLRIPHTEMGIQFNVEVPIIEENSFEHNCLRAFEGFVKDIEMGHISRSYDFVKDHVNDYINLVKVVIWKRMKN